MPDTESVGEPEARALAAAVAGVVRRGGEHLVVVTALGLGVGEGGHGEAAEEGEGDGGLHIQRKGLRAELNLQKVRWQRLREFLMTDD